MSDTVEIEVINTAKDYRRVLLWFYSKKLIALGVLYLVIIIPILCLTLFGAGASPFDERNKSVIIMVGFTALIPFIIVVGIFFNIWNHSRKIEKTLEPATFVFSDDGLESFSKSSSVKVTWDTLQQVRELKDDFLFYPQNNIFYTIPKRFFQSDSQIIKFKNLVREKLGNKAKLQN